MNESSAENLLLTFVLNVFGYLDVLYLCGESEIYYIYMTTELGVLSSYI